jgi:hypothetical protein
MSRKPILHPVCIHTSIHIVYNSGVKCHFLYRMILFVVFRSKSKTSCYVYNIVTGLLYLSFC